LVRAMYPNLKLQMWKCGIRQNRLARVLKIDETVLSKVVNGFREPSEDLRRRIALALDADAAWLFERENDVKTAPQPGFTNGVNSPKQ